MLLHGEVKGIHDSLKAVGLSIMGSGGDKRFIGTGEA